MASPETQKREPIRELADELRGRHGIESRTGVLGSERVEYFRGKDFGAFFKKHPEKVIAGLLPPGAKPDDCIREVMHLLIRRKLVVRTDRLYKKPKPGKKRLTKWPRKLVDVPPSEQRWSDDAFYAWAYDLPSSPYLLFGSIGLAAAVLLVCLFPLAPYQLKIGVVYVSVTLLGLLLGTILLRWVVVGVTWIAAGRALWLLPNLLSETVGLDEAFWPLWELEEVDEEWSWWRSHAWQRFGFAVTMATLVWGLHSVSPNKGELTSGAKATHDQVLQWLNLRDAQVGRLGNGTDSGNDTSVHLANPAQEQPAARPASPFGAGGIANDGKTAAAVTAAANARAAAAKAAADAAAAEQPERLPSFEELLEEEVAEAAAEAAAAARAAGGSEDDVQVAQQAAMHAVRARAAATAAREVVTPPPETPAPAAAAATHEEL